VGKIDTTVGQLVDMIHRGELRLPELQRRYVWTASRVRDLLDSLYRGYPSGTILVWETDQDVPERELAVAQQDNLFASHKLLLDGQQRLTSLAAIVRGQPLKLKRTRPIEIAFNLAHPDAGIVDVAEVDDDVPDDEDDDEEEETYTDVILERSKSFTFIVAWRNLYRDKHWIKVSDIFKGEMTDWQLLKPLGLTPDDPDYDKFSKRLQGVRSILQYPYVMHLLDRSLSYEQVAEIFVRVNSLGMKLRGSDLALALVTARWPTSLKMLEEFSEQLEALGYGFDLGLLVRTMVAFATKQSRFRTVGRIPVDKLQAAWEQAKSGLHYAVNFLRTNAGIEDLSLLSSPFFVIPVAVVAVLRGNQLSAADERQLLSWVILANGMGHYSASSETTLDADLSALFAGGGPDRLLDLLTQQQGRALTFSANDFEGRTARHPLFSTVYLALRQSGAKDWSTGLGVSLTHTGRTHYLQAHHIFPRSIMKGKAEPRQINEISNLAFVGGGTNRAFSNQPPEKYLPGVVDKRGESALTLQGVPTDPELWPLDQFEAFLEYRRRSLAAIVNKYIDGIRNSSGELPIDLPGLIAGGETEGVEFKQTMRVNTRRPTPERDEAMDREVVKSIAGFMNSNGGVLLIGVDDVGAVTGLIPDYATLGNRPNSDGFEQALRTLLASSFGKALAAEVASSVMKIEDQDVCVVRAPASSREVYANIGGAKSFFVRSGNTTQSLDMAEAHKYIDGRFR
jgi:hypothetical protein